MTHQMMIEGTGEELQDYLRNAPHDRFRLIHISDDQAGPSQCDDLDKQSLAEALAGYIGTASFGDANLSEDTGRKFARLLVEKHRKDQE